MNETTVFCAACQDRTAHAVSLDAAGEITLTCACGRFWKLPAGLSAADAKALVDAHEQANRGQVGAQSEEDAAAAVEAALALFK